MTVEEFDIALTDLETRIDRLRALYENWFRGYEKSEPNVPRKDAERRVYALRKELPRNTALRFRYHQMYLKFTTLANYWQRTSRQIEEGTYKPHLQRLKRKNDREQEQLERRERRRLERGEEKKEDGARGFELDLDESLDVDDLLDELEMDELALAIEKPGPHSEPPPTTVHQKLPEGPSTATFSRLKEEAPRQPAPKPSVDAPARGVFQPSAPFQPNAPGANGAARQAPTTPSGTTIGRPSPAATYGAAPPPRPPAPGATPPAPAGRPAAPMPAPGTGAGRPFVPNAPGAQAGAPAAAPGSVARPLPGAPGSAAKPLPPGVGMPASAAKPLPSAAGAPGSAAKPSLPGIAAPGGVARPLPPAPAAPVRPTTTTVGHPAPAPPGQRPAPAMPAASSPQRPAPGAALGTGVGGPARPAASGAVGAGAARPAPGAQAGGTFVGRPPVGSPLAGNAGTPSEQRMRHLYDEYAAARRRNNEGEVRYEALVSSIQKMLPELSKKHQGKKIDFDVVVKDGRVGLKPKAT